MRVVLRVLPWLSAVAVSAGLMSSAWAEGDGLSTHVDRVPWARFDARLLPLGAPSWRADLAPSERSGVKLGGLGVLGDMYFGSSDIRPSTGGFRATSGLIVGSRGQASLGTDRLWRGAAGSAGAGDAGADGSTVPYLGVGYSNAWPKSGWRLSADLGVVSYSPSSAAGIGRVLGGSQGLDDMVHEMRLAPVVQLGVSYSF